MSTGTPGADSLSGKGFGLQAFGGTELTLAGAPQFAVSANLSYHWFKTPVTGFDLGGLGVSVLGHWVREVESGPARLKPSRYGVVE